MLKWIAKKFSLQIYWLIQVASNLHILALNGLKTIDDWLID